MPDARQRLPFKINIVKHLLTREERNRYKLAGLNFLYPQLLKSEIQGNGKKYFEKCCIGERSLDDGAAGVAGMACARRNYKFKISDFKIGEEGF